MAVLRYSVAPAVYPTALLEAAASMKLIHEHAKEWHVDTDKIVVKGLPRVDTLQHAFLCSGIRSGWLRLPV